MSRMLSFRAEDDLCDRVKACSLGLKVPTSVWLREVVDKATREGVPVEEQVVVRTHPQRALVLQRTEPDLEPSDCVHPVTGRKKLPFNTICTACGSMLDGPVMNGEGSYEDAFPG